MYVIFLGFIIIWEAGIFVSILYRKLKFRERRVGLGLYSLEVEG